MKNSVIQTTVSQIDFMNINLIPQKPNEVLTFIQYGSFTTNRINLVLASAIIMKPGCYLIFCIVNNGDPENPEEVDVCKFR